MGGTGGRRVHRALKAETCSYRAPVLGRSSFIFSSEAVKAAEEVRDKGSCGVESEGAKENFLELSERSSLPKSSLESGEGVLGTTIRELLDAALGR